jgi:tRNA A37 N6-isopentenylltransferase MiaA
VTLDEIKKKSFVQDWRLAKRQLTWLRRNPFIQWRSLDESREYLVSLLASEH